MEGVNPRLFTQVEIMDVKQRASGIIPVDDCGFDMDGSEDEEEDDEDSELLKEERLKKKTAEEMKRSNERFVKNVGKEDDIDIDAI
jgi:hypothetical protein